MSAVTSDEADRQRISTGTDRRSVVVAGAGSGKTTHLVRRVANTINAGVDPKNVAVITFTDKAARELVHLLRAEQIRRLDDAYIGTIHGFCAAILRRYPIDAGLPPKFTTADEISSRTAATERRRELVRLVYEQASTDNLLLEALTIVAGSIGLPRLDSVVDVIDTQWHRFENLDTDPDRSESLVGLVDRYSVTFDEFVGLCTTRKPMLLQAIASHDALRVLPVTLETVLSFQPPSLGATGGESLKSHRQSLAQQWQHILRMAAAIVIRRIVVAFRVVVVAKARQRIADGQLGYDDLLILTDRLLTAHPDVRDELADRYQRIFVDEFQDTDAVQFSIIEQLTGEPSGSDAAASPRLFAVGDPKQSIYGFRHADVALFAGLADAAERGGYLAKLTANFRSRASVAGWINATMERRFGGPAKIAETAKKVLLEDGLWPLPPPIVAYEPLQPTRPALPADEPDPGPPVVVLGVDADGLPVAHPDTARAQQAEAADIVGLVQRVIAERWRVLEPAGRDADGRPLNWGSRLARRADIAVLVARRTGLATLESAMRTAAIPFRVEGGTLAYENREVYELLRVARAIDNPADELMLVTALRSSILGCSDADLFAYRYRQPATARGLWRLPAEPFAGPPPRPLDDSDGAGIARVRAAMSQIAAWSAVAHQMSPAMLLTTIYDWSMGVAAARFEGTSTYVETWRRVRFLVDEARAWTDEVGGTLREYLRWITDKVEAVDRSEIAPDERGEDAVRILTIHAAKGLQFPIVIVAALGAKDNVAEDSFKMVVVDGNPEFKFGSMRSPRYPGRDHLAAWAEEARLLYVAMTRAQDHLVLSCHTSERSSPNAAERLAPHIDLEGAERWSADSGTALRLPLGLADLQRLDHLQPVDSTELADRPDRYRRLVWTPSALASRQRQATAGEAGAIDSPPVEGSQWEESLDADEATEGFVDVRSVAVIRDADDDIVDPGHHKDPPSGRELVRSRGRYGTDVGIAVHEVMQLVDLADPLGGLEALVAVACDNVDLVGRARDRVSQLARSLIDSELFTRMRAAPACEREVYVGTLVGDPGEPVTLWGYIDAVFQCDDGSYAVVDFKTDSSAASAAALASRYGVQLNAYGVAVERSTGATVSELWLLVANAAGPALAVAVPRLTPDWPKVDRPVAERPHHDPPGLPPVGVPIRPPPPEQLTLL
jgi:ATP-dependent helicase/nuclease subunit A